MSESNPSTSVAEVPHGTQDEMFSRVISFFGNDAFSLVQKAKVVVVGLGGVGSHAAHLLARSGVNTIRLVCNFKLDHLMIFCKDISYNKFKLLD
jgi:tRNA A37 threonylcarbamoyladenosine dehydratase